MFLCAIVVPQFILWTTIVIPGVIASEELNPPEVIQTVVSGVFGTVVGLLTTAIKYCYSSLPILIFLEKLSSAQGYGPGSNSFTSNMDFDPTEKNIINLFLSCLCFWLT